MYKRQAVLSEAVGSTSTVVEGLIDDFSDFDFDPEVFQERTDEAVTKHAEIMDKLSGLLTQAIASEEQQRKQEELEARERAIREREEAEERRQQAEKQRIEREKVAAEAAEKARLEAEEKHKKELAEAEDRYQRQMAEAKAEQQQESPTHEPKEVQPEQEAKPAPSVVRQEQAPTRQYSVMELNAMDQLAKLVEEANKPYASDLREFVESVKANNLKKVA